jgi:hypothetical protein
VAAHLGAAEVVLLAVRRMGSCLLVAGEVHLGVPRTGSALAALLLHISCEQESSRTRQCSHKQSRKHGINTARACHSSKYLHDIFS